MGPNTAVPNIARVAIVDDSRSIRRWLRFVLEADPRLAVVGEAANAREARDLLRETPVDVITLDVDMPGMTGIEFLSRLMAVRPMPVVMLSALTEKGSREAVEALSLGAVDCIEKPKTSLGPDVTRDICDRIWQAAQITPSRTGRRLPTERVQPQTSAEKPWYGGVLLLGASTGGVSALETVLADLEGSSWPVVIAQHMPENFLHSFCRRLDEQFSRSFYMARDGHVLQSGQAVISLGKEVSTRLARSRDGQIVCTIGPPSSTAVHKPSVDDLFISAADARLNGGAALLTGMGSDGARGLLALRQTGLHTIAQDEATCVVFGMPKAAIALDAAVEVLPDTRIGARLANLSASPTRSRKGSLQC